MKKKITVEELNERAWYRAGKVVFIIIFLLVLTVSLIAVFLGTSDKTTWIRCDSGKQFEDVYGLYRRTATVLRCSDYKESLVDAVKTARDRGVSDYQIVNEFEKQNGRLNYETYYVPNHNLLEKLFYVLVTFVIVTVVFWFFARVLRYILVGESVLTRVVKRNNEEDH